MDSSLIKTNWGVVILWWIVSSDPVCRWCVIVAVPVGIDRVFIVVVVAAVVVVVVVVLFVFCDTAVENPQRIAKNPSQDPKDQVGSIVKKWPRPNSNHLKEVWRSERTMESESWWQTGKIKNKIKSRVGSDWRGMLERPEWEWRGVGSVSNRRFSTVSVSFVVSLPSTEAEGEKTGENRRAEKRGETRRNWWKKQTKQESKNETERNKRENAVTTLTDVTWILINCYHLVKLQQNVTNILLGNRFGKRPKLISRHSNK